MQDIIAVARQFIPDGEVATVREYGSGNINNTFVVTPAQGARFILQWINQRVFPEPALIMHNFRTFSEHLQARLRQDPVAPGRRWEMPAILPTRSGADYWVDVDGGFWRAVTFVEGAQTHPFIRDAAHAHEVGYALGTFHRLISDLDPTRLYDTLKGFHLVPMYLQHYDAVLQSPKVALTSPDVQHCMRVIARARQWGAVLEEARARGALQVRPVHGDPKVDNIMIDNVTGQAVSLIDLDTVKPGLIHYDIGDCLRSGCNPLGEEPDDPSGVRFETALCRAILGGYLPEAKCFLTPADYEYLYDGLRVLAFEMGLRFFTDYVEGDVYFKVRDARHNLLRALVQFKLLASIESHEADIRAIIRDLR